MVEVVHDATKESDAPRVAQCGGCRSLLRFRPSEARREFDARDGNALVIGCPVCGKDIWLSEEARHRRMASGY